VRLPESIELALFRMLQEALGNIQQHAGASAADIVIRRSDDQVVLEVKDNGHGMGHQMANRSSKTGLGLVSMHERARELGGTFHLESGSTGTLVKITIPVCPGCAFGGQDDA
jgi:two-component system NarL family sensor kinase